jgi:hypothetical protein
MKKITVGNMNISQRSHILFSDFFSQSNVFALVTNLIAMLEYLKTGMTETAKPVGK